MCAFQLCYAFTTALSSLVNYKLMTIALYLKPTSDADSRHDSRSTNIPNAHVYISGFNEHYTTLREMTCDMETSRGKTNRKTLYLTITTVETVTPTNLTKLLQPERLACPRTTTRSPTSRLFTHRASSASTESDDHIT